ncbi:prolyl oligopeptidase family serine peptidase [candidate division KSB1 bacterium]|nr:prolyl oligopeptidase family serine peptidase [candidate division KSB1 bacterium]
MKYLPGKKETIEVQEHPAFLWTPLSETTANDVPWVWYAPVIWQKRPDDSMNWTFKKFLDAGIAVAGIDIGESHGSPQGRRIYSAFYRDLVQQRDFSPKACLLPRSRGGLMLYNWAAENAECVACVAGIYPVCDLMTYPGLKVAGEVYGIAEDDLAQQLAQHNPIYRIEPLAKAGVPIFHIHGDEDDLVPLEQNSAELARRYRKFGGEMQVLIAKKQGHSMWRGFFECGELVDFVLTHARSL